MQEKIDRLDALKDISSDLSTIGSQLKKLRKKIDNEIESERKDLLHEWICPNCGSNLELKYTKDDTGTYGYLLCENCGNREEY